ncbi:type I restriction endonuclease [uncultured Desulfovibrio sp.]|uniref:type I restriction endonuclease n=1 Tax=uncultured Desulfovibrio sp. TaxID=167968 RepID=UPI0025FCB871|nr:type I restriction endonuclease [uncultured Desulfovibrio sp.]
MDFEERIFELAKRVRVHRDKLDNEQMTKNTLVMPFIQALGYDVFNPAEVVPEFSAPIGEYKDARVDYAILADGKPILLIECKTLGTELEFKHCNQLQIYFHGTDARIGILTDGNRYRFYSDLEAPNVMDTKPYMEFCLDDMEEALIPELRRLAKGRFDCDACVDKANELKYNREFKQVIARQMEEPDEDFVRFFIAQVYEGKITQNVRERFTPVLKAAMEQFLTDRINERLKNAMTQQKPEAQPKAAEETPDEQDHRIVTTEEEINGYNIVKAIMSKVVDPERVYIRDQQSYCGVILDNKNNRPICRLHFNAASVKYIETFDAEKKGTKHKIEKLSDIYKYEDVLRATAGYYEKA